MKLLSGFMLTVSLCLGLAAYVTGDAEITTAMSEADRADFGWGQWEAIPDLYIDPIGCLFRSEVRWASDANDIVGYFNPLLQWAGLRLH